MASDLAERIEAIHAEAIKDIRGKLVNTTNHDLELLLEWDKGPLPFIRIAAEQILAERKATGAKQMTDDKQEREGVATELAGVIAKSKIGTDDCAVLLTRKLSNGERYVVMSQTDYAAEKASRQPQTDGEQSE